MAKAKTFEVIPSARRMVQSLRDLGYEFPTAVADLIDNSLTAGASSISIEIAFNGLRSWVRIADNGRGMSSDRITEALRYGSDETYGQRDLGKFGLGLKTASMSQCRRLTVASRDSRESFSARRLDLDRITKRDRWEITDASGADPRLAIAGSSGTVVLWEHLDRVLQYKSPDSEWARAGLRGLADRTDQHLSMVLHRFLSGTGHGKRKVAVTINGTAIDPWDPYARAEPATVQHAEGILQITAGAASGSVRYAGFVLPTREQFSSELAFRRAGGPKKWNRQQGFYVYRADRMIQGGGWSWMRTADEHTKLARMSIDFLPELDAALGINVAKVRVTLPTELRTLLEEPVGSLVKAAQAAYRNKASDGTTARHPSSRGSKGAPAARLAAALSQAARQVNEEQALMRIAKRMREDSPEAARDIGW